MRKITVRHEPSFDVDGPLARGAVQMRVTFVDGSREEKLLRHPRGQRIEPMSNRGIVGKFRALTAGVVGPARQREIESLVLNVERLADIRELIDALAPAVANALA